MKKYIFIVTDRNRNNLHVGLSSDIMKTMDFYKKMPNLLFDSSLQLTRLVYFEEFTDEQNAGKRFDLVSKYTRMQKEKMVRAVNNDWLDLTLALQHEHLTESYQLPQHVLSFAS